MNLDVPIPLKKINSIFLLSLIISFALISIYSSVVFFQISSLKIFFCSIINLFFFFLILKITRKHLFKLDLNINRDEILIILLNIISFVLLFILPISLLFYYSPFPLLGLDLKLDTNTDLYWHVSLINSIIDFGYPGTNLNDVNMHFYHVLSHYLDALLIKITGLDPLESYALLFYFKFILFLNCIVLIISENFKVLTFRKYLVSILFFIPVLLYNYEIFWGSAFTLAFLLVLIFFNKICKYIEQKNLNHKDLIVINLIIISIYFAKVSVGCTFFLVTYLLLSKNNFFGKVNYKFIFHFIIIGLIIFYFSTFFISEVTVLDTKTISDYVKKIKYYLFIEILVLIKLLTVFLFNKFFFTKKINYFLFSFFFSAILILLLKFTFNKFVYYFFLLSYDFIFNLFFFKVIINKIFESNFTTSNIRDIRKLKYIAWLFNFILNKILLSLLIFYYFSSKNFKNAKKKIQAYLLIVILSFSSLYYFNGFYLLNFSIKNIHDAIIYYNNYPFTKVVIYKNFFKEDGFATLNNRMWDETAKFELNNKILNTKDHISVYRLLVMTGEQKREFFNNFDLPLLNFRANLNEFITKNNLDRKKILLFFPKEIFYNYFFASYPNLERRYWGFVLYAATRIPLINGVYSNENIGFGFSSYTNESLFENYDTFKANFNCKNKKDIIIVRNILLKDLELIKCI
jgi:hypothetical protein